MRHVRRLLATSLMLLISAVATAPGAAAPEGQMTWAVHFVLAPTWFDPAETSGIITPFVVLYALHDAVVKPLPGGHMAPSPTANYLQAVGIRVKIRPLERAAFFKAYSEKKLKNLIQGGSGAWGNAATRIEAFVASGGAYVYGSYPDIDGLIREQATEVDRKRRESMLHRIQQLINEKVMLAPIWQLAALIGVGPRVEESGIGLVAGYAFFSAPYEEVKLKAK